MPTPHRLLSSTARSTFESLALLLAEPLGAAGDAGGDAAAALGAGAVGARVAFTGQGVGDASGGADGALTVRVSAPLAAALAENMLGTPDPAPAARGDAVGEFANVVCGHVLSAAAGPAPVFRLAAPVVGDALAGVHAGVHAGVAVGGAPAEGAWHVWLDVEGEVACVTLEGPAALFA